MLALGSGRLIVGWSERTDIETIEALAARLIRKGFPYDELFAVSIPRERGYTHLDTVFTLIGRNRAISFSGSPPRKLEYRRYFRQGPSLRFESGSSFLDLLEKDGFDIVRAAGGSPGRDSADQRTNATNILAVADSRVVSYGFNRATNQALRASGVEVVEIEGSELAKGRGGPRSLILPVQRLVR